MMKKKLLILLLMLVMIIPTGCSIKRDSMEDITIYTSSYPIEYITKALYGNHSTVKNIYPNGIVNNSYTLTDEQIKQYSKSSLFIFNGLGTEKSYIEPMLNDNSNLKIIDSTKSITYDYGEEELWLNPSNILMMTQNIKNGLEEYISNQYLKNDIETNYQSLKLTISKLEAKIYLMVEDADNTNIVVGNDSLEFLSKYGLTVYSVEDTNNLTDKTIETVKKMANNKQISYIFMFNNDNSNDTIDTLVKTYGLKIVYLNDLSNLSDTDRKNNKDYVSVMNDNIDALRAEIYND